MFGNFRSLFFNATPMYKDLQLDYIYVRPARRRRSIWKAPVQTSTPRLSTAKLDGAPVLLDCWTRSQLSAYRRIFLLST